MYEVIPAYLGVSAKNKAQRERVSPARQRGHDVDVSSAIRLAESSTATVPAHSPTPVPAHKESDLDRR